jgi:DNA processing protein
VTTTRDQLKATPISIALAITHLSPRLQTEAMQIAREAEDLLAVMQSSDLWRRIASFLASVEHEIDVAHTLGLHIVPFGDRFYPAQLSDLSYPPPILFIRSQLPLTPVWPPCISIVGARKASMEMCSATTRLACGLNAAGLTVVSGLALGVDGAAHRGALLNPGDGISTIAVLAHGLDQIYPSSHQALGEEIVRRGGVLLSEYPPGTQPLRHHFLSRNRIIAALSTATIVVQAGERSGSLVTAQAAVDIGREVLVLQGDSDDPSCAGGRRLLEDGAIPITGVEEVLELCGVGDGAIDKGSPPVTGGVRLPLTEFIRLTQLSGAAVVQLELAGSLSRVPGNYVVVNADEWARLTA